MVKGHIGYIGLGGVGAHQMCRVGNGGPLDHSTRPPPLSSPAVALSLRRGLVGKPLACRLSGDAEGDRDLIPRPAMGASYLNGFA